MRLQVYILLQLLLALSFAIGGILFVALPGIAASTVHRLPNADAMVLVRYLPVVLKTLVPYVLPICFLLALVATYGRLAADREWTAIQMAGIQPLKMLLPALVTGLALSGVSWWMVSNELPELKQSQRRLLIEGASSSISNLSPGRTRLQLGGFYMKGAWRDPDGVFREVFIHRPDAGGDEPNLDIFAETARIRVVDEVLYVDLTGLRFMDPQAGTVGATDKLSFRLPFEELLEHRFQRDKRPRFMTTRRILTGLAEGSFTGGQRRAAVYQLHHRAALSVAYLLFIGLGVPTGLLLRRGTQLGALAVAAGFGIVYYVLTMRVGKTLGMSGSLPPWVGAWASTILGSAISLPLLRRALRR